MRKTQPNPAPLPFAPLQFAPFPGRAMPALDGDTGADVCVVGASLAGLRTAYDLLQNGKSVVVIESAPTLPGLDAATVPGAPRLGDLLGADDARAGAQRAPASSNELAYAIVQLGGRIHGATRVLDISAEHNMQVVTTYQGAIVARVVVVATDQARPGSGLRGGGAAQARPGDTPALRVLATPAPDIAALFKPFGQRRAA
jgi:glycine/D-amino acid oxidase-like deaminating enzyme